MKSVIFRYKYHDQVSGNNYNAFIRLVIIDTIYTLNQMYTKGAKEKNSIW